MMSPQFLLLLIFFLIVPTTCRRTFEDAELYQKKRLKPECLQRGEIEGRGSVNRCWYWQGLKGWWRRNSISWFPSKTKNWTLDQVKEHCDTYFTCMENTKCYKDYILFETLDRCTTDAFTIGPMSFCIKTLQRAAVNSNLTSCVKEHLDKPTILKDCESVRQWGDCFADSVEKFCDPALFKMFQEHQNLRLYNLGCDGKLKFMDVDEKNLNSTSYSGN